MRFLFDGAKLSRGMQKLRHFLLLLLRTLAVAGLIFGLGRPLAGGWVGKLGGGQPDTVLILLDRSASMGETLNGGGGTKLEAGVAQITQALKDVQPGHLQLIDSVSMQATAVESVRELAGLPLVSLVDAQSDIPGMFEVAAEYLAANIAGRSEIWVCSDGQVGDWRPEDGRWQAIEGKLQALQAGVRVNVLHFSQQAAGNLGVRVTRAEWVSGKEGSELVLDLFVRGSEEDPKEVPVAIDVATAMGHARSSVSLEGSGQEWQLLGHRLRMEGEFTADHPGGWGFAELGPDGRGGDNRYYFVFGPEKAPETVIVSERPEVGRVLRIAAESFGPLGADPMVRDLPMDGALGMDLTSAGLLLWEGPLPRGDVALRVQTFLDDGGQVVFFAPEGSDAGEFLGCSWGERVDRPLDGGAQELGFWRKSEGFFRNGDDGTPLDFSELRILRSTEIRGEVTLLAGFEDGQGLLARTPTERGGVSFFGSTPAHEDSNLAVQGLALVALIQRAGEQAESSQLDRAQQDAGAYRGRRSDVEWLSEDTEGLISERLHRAGVLRNARGMVALNRPSHEDTQTLMATERIAELMPGIEMDLAEGRGQGGALIEEIWKLFLGFLVVALLLEALICLPESTVEAGE